MILLSVHLITYNNEDFLRDTLNSILCQEVNFTYEIVVGDDSSQDKTFDILKEYRKIHPKLFKIHQNKKRVGILQNFKYTLDRCQGKYIFDIAGDDYLKEKDALQKMVNTFKENPEIGFIDCGFDILDENTTKVSKFHNQNIIISNKQDYRDKLFLGNIAPIGHCYKRKELYKAVDFETYIRMNVTIEDYPILVDMVMKTDFERINDSLLIYRVHNNSYSHRKDFEEMVFQKQQMKNLFDFFSKKYSFNEELQFKFNEEYLKELLFLSGYFNNKLLGNKVFKKIKTKNIRDWIHYYSSQYSLFRKIISIKKRVLSQ